MPTDVLAPIPGDPLAVRTAGRTMQSIAAEVTATAAKLRNLATSTWTGEAAARASARAASLPPKLDKVRVSYASAGAALARYAVALDDAQQQSTSARAAAQRANDDLNSARTAHEEAQSADARAAAAATASGQPTPAPAAPRYEAAITEAAARLKHAVEANADAHEAHDRAARVAAASLKEASREGIHNRPWWRHVASAACHWAATQWATALRTLSRLAATISALAGIAALALSIAGIFFPPLEIAAATLESISAATTVLATLAGTALAMTGKGSWLAAGIDALSFLPAGASKLVGKTAPRLRTFLRRRTSDVEERLAKTTSKVGAVDKTASASMADGPGRPAVIHEPWGVTRIGRDDDSVFFAEHAPVAPGEHNVVVHGLPHGWPNGITTEDVAKAVRRHPDWSEGTRICLYSCYGASNGTAAELASTLGTSVRAPTTPVTIDFKLSTVPILERGGKWQTFQ